MSYHLDGYGLLDRDLDGIADEPKSDKSRRAVAEVIASQSPELLAALGLGSRDDLAGLATDLAARGLAYPHQAWREGRSTCGGVAILSQFPIVSHQSPTGLVYRIGDTALTDRPTILDVSVLIAPSRLLRVVVAECKDKRFHSLGQTEMRRNEARLLSNHLRETLAGASPTWVLTTVALNDEPGSAPLRRLVEPGPTAAIDLCPRDQRGRAWTRANPDRDAFLRTDFLLASPALEQAGVQATLVDHPQGAVASRHRPFLTRIPTP